MTERTLFHYTGGLNHINDCAVRMLSDIWMSEGETSLDLTHLEVAVRSHASWNHNKQNSHKHTCPRSSRSQTNPWPYPAFLMGHTCLSITLHSLGIFAEICLSKSTYGHTFSIDHVYVTCAAWIEASALLLLVPQISGLGTSSVTEYKLQPLQTCRGALWYLYQIPGTVFGPCPCFSKGALSRYSFPKPNHKSNLQVLELCLIYIVCLVPME